MKRQILQAFLMILGVLGASVLGAQENDLQRATPLLHTPPEVPASSPSGAVVPRFIKFSGMLQDMASKPIAGATDVTFALYAEEAGGTALWYETQTLETDALGRYTVLLGAMHANGVPVELFTSGEARWLGVQVGNLPETAQGGRVLLVSVPYALKAVDAETLGGKPASAYMLAPTESRPESGQEGSSAGPGAPSTNLLGTGGTTQPKPLVASGPTTFSGTTTNQIVLVQQLGTGVGLSASAPSNSALTGTTAGTGSTLFAGVFGLATGASGAGKGVIGEATGPTGAGVYGLATSSSGTTYGLLGTSQSTGGVGIQGQATATTGSTVALQGVDYSSSGVGLSGTSLATSGATIGVRAFVKSAAGTAMVVNNTAGGKLISAQNNGVEKLSVDGSGNVATSGSVGITDSATGATALNVQATELTTANTAIDGVADGLNGTGVVGEAENGSLAFGVMGISSSGFAGDFSGNVNVTGTLSAASKNFKIDDPVDPANKFLFHASVESSELKTIYDGAVQLDTSGQATVLLPSWFQALNGEFRYQLTCVGGYAPVYIAEKIQSNQFKIAGGYPGLEVDWQVTGVRHDPYAQTHPLGVEIEKPANERGYYLQPELYGEPRERSIEWADHPELMKHLTRTKSSRPRATPSVERKPK